MKHKTGSTNFFCNTTPQVASCRGAGRQFLLLLDIARLTVFTSLQSVLSQANQLMAVALYLLHRYESDINLSILERKQIGIFPEMSDPLISVTEEWGYMVKELVFLRFIGVRIHIFLTKHVSVTTGTGAARQTFTSSGEMNIASCPITYYGQKYDRVYVSNLKSYFYNIYMCFHLLWLLSLCMHLWWR